MNRGRWGGGAAAGVKKSCLPAKGANTMKAKCAHNTEGLDRLWEARKKVEEKNPNSNFAFTIKRAMKALAGCTEPVTTYKEAVAIKFIGHKLALVICPLEHEGEEVATTAAKKSSARSRAKKTQLTLVPVQEKQSTGQTASSALPPESLAEAGPSRRQLSYDTAKKAADEMVLPPAPWKVILIIDGREQKSKHMIAKCQQSGIPCEERMLPIGDMAWIAQCAQPNGPTIEILCGTIVERKEVSDLAQSLFGTRYLEQRLRLQNCGLPQVLFLVEGDLNTCSSCPPETLEMAMMETRIQLGFDVVRTKHVQDTVRLLKGLHRRVVQRTFPDAFASFDSNLPSFGAISPASRRRRRKHDRRPTSLLEMMFDTKPRAPFGMDRFLTYAELKFKVERDREAGTRTVGALSLAMLKQVPTLSDKKCFAVSQLYPTMGLLLQAYAKTEDPELMVQEIPCNQQKIGPKSSKELYITCCTRADGTIPSGKKNPYRRAVVPTTAVGASSAQRTVTVPATLALSTVLPSSSIPARSSTQPKLPKLPPTTLNRPTNSAGAKPPSSPSPTTISTVAGRSTSDSLDISMVDLTGDTPQKPPARQSSISAGNDRYANVSMQRSSIPSWSGKALALSSSSDSSRSRSNSPTLAPPTQKEKKSDGIIEEMITLSPILTSAPAARYGSENRHRREPSPTINFSSPSASPTTLHLSQESNESKASNFERSSYQITPGCVVANAIADPTNSSEPRADSRPPIHFSSPSQSSIRLSQNSSDGDQTENRRSRIVANVPIRFTLPSHAALQRLSQESVQSEPPSQDQGTQQSNNVSIVEIDSSSGSEEENDGADSPPAAASTSTSALCNNGKPKVAISSVTTSIGSSLFSGGPTPSTARTVSSTSAETASTATSARSGRLVFQFEDSSSDDDSFYRSSKEREANAAAKAGTTSAVSLASKSKVSHSFKTKDGSSGKRGVEGIDASLQAAKRSKPNEVIEID